MSPAPRAAPQKVTALYYPHTTLRSKLMIKNALLLWDTVECIIPYPNFREKEESLGPLYQEGVERIVTGTVPRHEEKVQADADIKEFVRIAQPQIAEGL